MQPDAQQREWERSSEVHGPAFLGGSAADGEPTPKLVVFGAVPLAASLCRVARTIGWAPYLVDPRARFATADRFPDAEEVLHLWPDDAFTRLSGPDAATAVALLTHAPELDDRALVIALRSPAFYVGAMGSRRTQGRRRERLTAVGLGDTELGRLSGPAGLDLGGTSAAEAALAILAEAVAAWHGRAGGRLTTSENSIHAGGRS